MGPLCAAAAERHIPVIEDAAQSIGAEYLGRRAGSLARSVVSVSIPRKIWGPSATLVC